MAIGVIAGLDLVLVLTSTKNSGYRGVWSPGFGWFVVVLGALVFLVWSWRAHANAVALSRHRHRRTPRLAAVWVVLGWIVPVVSLWFPYLIMADQYRSSGPHRTGNAPVVGAWWILDLAWSGMLLFSLLSASAQSSGRSPLLVAMVLVEVVDAALAILIILRIGKWQESARHS
nr:hypothetical protein GCM10017745_49310 [Saccharothrix mutabilis subsp. capreolus]